MELVLGLDNVPRLKGVKIAAVKLVVKYLGKVDEYDKKVDRTAQ